jgi:hypothetical protein
MDTVSKRHKQSWPVYKTATLGGLIFAALTFAAALCFHLFGHGSGESGPWVLFVFIRAFAGLPTCILFQNPSFVTTGFYTSDALFLIVNGLLGAIIFTLFAVIAKGVVKRKRE